MISEYDFKQAILEDPVIIAIIDERTYELALGESHKIVFLLDASVSNLREKVKGLLSKGKMVFVHIDMVAGLTSTSAVVDFIADLFDGRVGIITTKHSLIKRANQRGIRSIYRGFMVDSKSKKIFKDNLKSGIKPNAIEILPAFVDKVICEIAREFPNLIIIAGGLITEKKEVYTILNSGAKALSTSCIKILRE